MKFKDLLKLEPQFENAKKKINVRKNIVKIL